MSTENEVRQACDQYYTALNHLLNGDAELMMEGVASRLKMPANERTRQKADHHGRPNRPAMTLMFHHMT